ncbi:hypothetical protein N0V94_005561 [Neodidymelliopsis sp. IMI 364377]|nr:hypothetical protein N0V94_005561 [Neodidymelliopsis sp. IMI 364377]
MTQKTCKHPVFPTLRKNLVALDIKSCPSCLIRHYIYDITELQAALERRGGIFVSRDAALNERLGYGREKDLHKDLMRRWRIAKIGLHRQLSQLEALQEEGARKARWSIQLEKAFELWQEVEIECSRVPGYRDVEVDSGHDTEEAVKLQVNREHDPDLREVHATSSPTDQQEDVDMGVASIEDTDCATSDFDEPTLLGMEGVTLRPKPKVYWDRSNPYDLLRDMDTDEEEPSPSSPSEDGRSLPQSLDITPNLPTTNSDTTSPTPPAKRRRISDPNPHVSIHPLVTTILSPSLSPSPSPFDPPLSSPLPRQPPTHHHPHPLHTTAETARKRITFWRRAKAYVPFMWAVSGERELLDTSFYRMSWEEYEKLEGRNEDENHCEEQMVAIEQAEKQEVG